MSWQASAGGATPANEMKPHASVNSEARAEQAASVKFDAIKLGLDVHAERILVARIVDHGSPQPPQCFGESGLLAWAKRQLDQAREVHACYEAGPFGYGLYRKLVALGVKCLVVQPVNLDERNTRVNNDRTDARELVLRLDRYVSGNTKALAIVRVPTPEEEQRRIQSRQREQLQREIKRVAAQGRSLLLTQGYREKGVWWSGPRWEALSQRLPAWLIDHLQVFRNLLDTLEKLLSSADARLKASAPLSRPKGLGALTHQVLESEVQDWNRFNNRRQVASYTGLCGGISASGSSVRLLSITKHGNVRLRTALIELAWRMVMWQPQCRLIQKWRSVLLQPRATRGARKKAIVAVARQLAVDLWRWRTGRATPQTFGWVMIGTP
jgi:transposase